MIENEKRRVTVSMTVEALVGSWVSEERLSEFVRDRILSLGEADVESIAVTMHNARGSTTLVSSTDFEPPWRIERGH